MSYSVAASIGNMPFATGGSANGPHLVYAKNNNTYWVFWLSSTSTLNAAYWNGTAWTTPTSGATFTLPTAHGSEGRSFTVVSTAIGSNDVFGIGYATGPDYIRIQVGATSLTWGSASSPGSIGGGGATPYAAGVGFDSNNKPVMHWQESGDDHGAWATNADSGTAWTSGWGSDTTILSASNQVYSRQLLPGTNGYVLLLNDAGSASSATGTNSSLDGKYVSALASDAALISSLNYEMGDWCGCVLDSTPNFGVVVLSSGVLKAYAASVSSNVLGSWTALPTVPTSGLTIPAKQSGIGLCSDGSSKLYLFVIDSGTGNPVKYCVYTKGTTWTNGSWGTWTTLESSTQTRNALTACQSTDGTSVWVLWTETVTSGSQYSVVSGLLTLGASAHNQATKAQSTFLVLAGMGRKDRATFETRVGTLATATRDTFQVRAGLATRARSTFRVFLALKEAARSTFKVFLALGEKTRATYQTRVLLGSDSYNLLTANQSDIETDTGGFSTATDALLPSGIATAVRDTSTAWHGAASLHVNSGANGGTASGVEIDPGISTPANATVTVSFYYKTPSANWALRFYDFTNNTAPTSGVVLPAAPNWTRAAYTFTMGASASSDLRFCLRNGSSSTDLWLDGLQVELSPTTGVWNTGQAGSPGWSRATFSVRAGLATRLRDTFKIGVGGLHTISTWAHATFASRAGLQTHGRDTFATRATGLGLRPRATFATRTKLAAHLRDTFLVRLALLTRARDTFVGRALLTGNTRASFQTRFRVNEKMRGTFSVRTKLAARARDTFKVATRVVTHARDTFKVNGQVVVLPFEALWVSTKQKLSATFTTLQKLSGTFTTAQRLSAAFIDMEPSLANPLTTIVVKMQATDITGAHPANLSAVSVLVTFPDGSQQTYTMANGDVTNNADGTYSLTYTTKMVGQNTEVWTFTAANGTDTDTEQNITPVSF